MTIDASALSSSNTFTFDGSSELDGSLNIIAGAASDTVTGGQHGNTFDLSKGGTDYATGGTGTDVFNMGAKFDAHDRLDGVSGNLDTVVLNGNYAGGLVLGVNSLKNIDQITLTSGFSYKLTMNDGNVGANETMGITYNNLVNQLTFDGSAETDGSFVVAGSLGDDVILGGNQGDSFVFGLSGTANFTAADRVNGRGGEDYLHSSGFDRWDGLRHDHRFRLCA